jgi:predicted HTH domain antitoxin
MTIEVPDVKIGSQPLTNEQARLDFAIGLYTGRHASLGHAAKVAGLPKTLFMRELGRREIPMHYRIEDVEHDWRLAEELAGKTTAA